MISSLSFPLLLLKKSKRGANKNDNKKNNNAFVSFSILVLSFFLVVVGARNVCGAFLGFGKLNLNFLFLFVFLVLVLFVSIPDLFSKI